MSAPEHDVIVVGGGVVGAAQALALAQRGFKVALVERAGAPAPYDPRNYDLRVYALAPSSVRWLDALGVWQPIREQRACAYQAMRVWDDHSAQALSFDAAEVRQPQLGYIVENELLLTALWAAMSGVSCYTQTDVAAYTPSSADAVLTLADGRQLRARLIVAADGAQSRLREMAGIEVTSWPYPQTALVCHVVSEKPHRHTAYQRFLPAGPLAFLPLADGRCSIVWSSTQAEQLLGLSDTEFLAHLAEAIQFELGALTHCTRRLSFPLRLLHARDYVRERLVLIGDAAHVIHPLAGQGVNLGLADVEALTTLLTQAREQDRDLGGARLLKRYERARKAENIDMLAITDGLYRAFGSRAPAWDGLRLLGMSAVNQLPLLKNFLVRRAIGR